MWEKYVDEFGRVKYVGVVGEVCGQSVWVKWEGKVCGCCC